MLLIVAVVGGILSAIHAGVTKEYLWTRLRPWLTVAAAAGVHEMGHIIAARVSGVRVGGLHMDILGARLELTGILSYGQEFIVAAGGPFFSLVSAALLYPTATGRESIGLFCGVSMILGAVNLLPVGTLDGGRMLRCCVAWFRGDTAAATALQVTTGLCLGGLWLVTVYALLQRTEMLSAFAFSLCLLWRALGNGVLLEKARLESEGE
jgi:membrane-associated protease RseP (regulator of RpoE activity)